jgi:cobalt/nickel transport system permease protein
MLMATAQDTLLNMGRMDTLARQDSPIHRLDPRSKVVTMFVFIVCVVSFPKYTLSGLIPYFVFPVTLILLGNLPTGFLLKRIAIVCPFAVLLGIFNPFLDRRILLEAGPLSISGGCISFVSILLRFILTVAAVLILIALTGFDSICMALQKLKIPRLFTLQLLFLYRYLFLLMEEAARLVRARSLRTFGIHGGGLSTLGPIIGGLLLRTLDRAERISGAMHCRAFDGIIPLCRDLKPGWRDFLFVTVWSGLFIFFRWINMSESLGRFLTGQAG